MSASNDNVGATRRVARGLPARRSIRLPHYDYTQPNAYFVTICADNRRHLFGEIRAGIMGLSALGCLVVEEWLRTTELRPTVELDEFVMMPNHCHGIIIFHNVPETTGDPAGRPYLRPNSLGAILGQFKSAVSKRAGQSVWQRNYFEHVIRDERGMAKIRAYIFDNPLTWTLDRENPHRQGPDEFDRWLRAQPVTQRATQRVAPTGER